MTPTAVGEGGRGASREHNERFRLKFYPSFVAERFGVRWDAGDTQMRRFIMLDKTLNAS